MVGSNISSKKTITAESTAIPTTTSNPKKEDDAKTTLKNLAACHRQFYHHLSHVPASNIFNAITTANVNEENITIMSAPTSTCTDKKTSPAISAESAERIFTVKPVSKRDDQLNDHPSPLRREKLSDSGRIIDDIKTIPASNNVMRVLNSSADVSDRPLTESSAPITTKAGVPMETESHQGCRHLGIAAGGKALHNRRRRGSKPSVTVANLIRKAIDVSNTADGSDFPTHTTMNVTFGSGVDIGCSTDVNNDKLSKIPTASSNPISTITATVQCHSELQPLVSNQNKWTSTEEPNVSCYSTFEASTSSSPQSFLRAKSCFSSFAPVKSPKVSVRQSLVEQRKRDLFERSQEDTRARSRSRSPIAEELDRNSPKFPSVTRLVKMYTKILQDNKQPATVKDTTGLASKITEDLEKKLCLKDDEEQLKPSIDPHRNSPLSDEGCTLGQSPYSSDCDDDDVESVKPAKKRREKVARSASSDSALGLDEEPMEPPACLNQGRRMTLTVTDLPLRPALLPLAEPTDLPDSPTTDIQISLNALLNQNTVPSKVLLEERVVEIPEDRFGSLSSSRRESAQSCVSDYQNSECGGVRFVRTPSVVVSDYSDDLMCGITLEEIEYFRAQRLRRRSSVETSGTEKDDAASDVSASSSCSNLYYCGSTISALDGAECYVNGIRMPIDRKISDCSTCEGSGDEDSQSFVIPEQPEDLKDYISYCTEQMVAQKQLANRKPKKVGGTTSNTDTYNTNSNCSDP